jgi:cell shape-determining protein MreC
VHWPAPLVQGSALAGRTTAVSAEAGEVELVTALPFRARCRNIRTGVEGIVRGGGGLEMRFRPDGADPDLREGDEIVTSVFSSIAPGALAVGTVVHAERDPETGLVEAIVVPAAALLHLEEALIVLPRKAGT